MTDIITSEDRVRTIVREETADLRSDVEILKNDVGELKLDVYRLGILYEDLNSKIDKVLELLSDALGRKPLTA